MKSRTTQTGVLLAATVMGFGLIAGPSVGQADFTQPEFTPPSTQVEDYVDPETRNRTRCRDHPGRPGWMMVQPLGFEWRLDLANKFRTNHRTKVVTQAESCDCGMLYPNWNSLRPSLEEIWEGVSTGSQYDWDDQTHARYNEARDEMTDFSRPLLQTVVKLCQRVE